MPSLQPVAHTAAVLADRSSLQVRSRLNCPGLNFVSLEVKRTLPEQGDEAWQCQESAERDEQRGQQTAEQGPPPEKDSPRPQHSPAQQNKCEPESNRIEQRAPEPKLHHCRHVSGHP